jgi:hypothetical protein
MVVKEKNEKKRKSGGILAFFGIGKKDEKKQSSSDESLDEEVYKERNMSAQMCDSDDLAGDLNLSD